MTDLSRRTALTALGGVAAGIAAAGITNEASGQSRESYRRNRSRSAAGDSDRENSRVAIQLTDIDIDLDGIQYKIPSIPIFPFPYSTIQQSDSITKSITLPNGTTLIFTIGTANAPIGDDQEADSWTYLERISSDGESIQLASSKSRSSRAAAGFSATASVTVSWPW